MKRTRNRVVIELTPAQAKALFSAIVRADSEWESEEMDEGMGQLRIQRRQLSTVTGKLCDAAVLAKVRLT